VTLRLLPEVLANRIAAGEVVERPAAVVKELVENSIDAGATRIEILVRDGGRAEIAVADNGQGMTAAELELCIERHATSKLADDDLQNIKTLGFRGEALPSIGAVARLTLASRAAGAGDAWQIRVEGGVKFPLEPAARQKGTRVEVRDIFYATPARLKFLKSPRTEQSHILDVLRRLAMAHPAVGFSLADGERVILKLPPGGGDLFEARLDRVSAIMGRDFAANALVIDAERDGFNLGGHVGLPTLNGRNAAKQFLFVNGRPVRDKLLFGALRGAYRDVLAADRYPLAALFLGAPFDQVDVNVHPAKTEVRFRDAVLVRGLIVGAVRHALAAAGHRAASQAPPFSSAGGRYPSGSRLAETATGYHAPLPGFDAPPAATEVAAEMVSEYPLGVARAQVHETYIVAQTADGMVIVDQHAAHERLVHEKIKESLAAGGVARQGLLIPEVVELDAAAAARLCARAAELEELGLTVEPFGPGAVMVREAPALLGEADIQGMVRDLADDLAELGDAVALKDRLGDVCATMACHGSVRAGRKLNGAEMNALLREMEQTPLAGQCSHGRPTYIELKLTDIEKLFGRR
jgi:DNA mismatch repair protein MutL